MRTAGILIHAASGENLIFTRDLRLYPKQQPSGFGAAHWPSACRAGRSPANPTYIHL